MENNTYRFTTSSSFPGMAPTAAFNFMQPLFNTLKAVGINVANPTIGSARPYGSPRGGTGDRPVNTRYRSRLLPRENWEDANLFNKTMRAIRTAVEGGFNNNFYFHGTLTSPTEQVAGVSNFRCLLLLALATLRLYWPFFIRIQSYYRNFSDFSNTQLDDYS